MTLRCAAYARYSSDLQSPLSIDDQLRICREYAKSRGFAFVEQHVYTDEAVSGVGADRPGLRRLMDAALSPSRPFDVILLDDSSRLARNTKDALQPRISPAILGYSVGSFPSSDRFLVSLVSDLPGMLNISKRLVFPSGQPVTSSPR